MKKIYILIDKDTGEIYEQCNTRKLAEQEQRENYSGRHCADVEDNPDIFIKIVRVDY